VAYFGLNKTAYIQLHISVFLWGFTAILGELITLSSIELVWWRMMFAFVSLLFLRRARKGLRGMSRTEVVKIGLNGGLLALHWVAFYAAIKMANPTIALVGLSTTSFFTAIFEPILSRKAIVWPDVFIGFVAIPGMILIYKNVDFQMVTGLWVGIGAAVVLAIFSIISKKQIENSNALGMSFVQLSGGWLFICLALFLLPSMQFDLVFPTGQNLWLLLIMAIFCTTIPFILSLKALRKLSAFTSNLTLNLEPVYGIFMAWIFLNDAKELSTGFVLGVLIVLVSVLSYPLLYPVTHKGTSKK